MSEINWKNQYETLDSGKLISLYERYLSEGFKYSPFNHLFNNGPVVRTPSRRELTPAVMQQILDSKLIFGDKLQLETLAAVEFMKIKEAVDHYYDDIYGVKSPI